MPADFDFRPSPTFHWSAPVQAAATRKSANSQTTKSPRKSTPRRSKPKRKPGFTPRQRTILQDRLEDAVAAGLLTQAEFESVYDRVMHALFPEDYPRGPKPLPEPTQTAPGSVDRVKDYVRRERAGEQLYSPRDLDASANDRYLVLAKILANGRARPGEVGVYDEDREGADADEWEHVCAA